MSDLETPWSKARKLRSQEHERRVASMTEGSAQVNSGRFWRWSRDAKVWNFLVEARSHEKPDVESYRISIKEWKDIRKQAFQTPPGLRPAMAIEIQDVRLFVIEESDFEAMYARLIALEALQDADE